MRARAAPSREGRWRLAAGVVALAAFLAAGFWPVIARQQSLLPVMPTVVPGPSGPVFVLDPMAPAWIVYPLGFLVNRIWEAGALPLWNAFSSCGEPLLAGVQAGVTSPLRFWQALVPPSPGVWDLYCLLRLLLAGAGALFLGRVLGLGPLPATAGGVAYMLSGFLVVNIGLDAQDAEVCLPLLVATAIRLASRPAIGRWLACVAAGSCVLLVGNPQVAIVDGAFVAVVAAAAAWRGRRAERDPSSGKRFAVTAAAGGVAAAVAAPVILPILDFLPRAQHVHGGAGSAAEPLWGILSVVAPWALGTFGQPWGGVAAMHFLPYAGASVAALSLLGARDAWRTPAGPAFCLAPVLLLAAAYGLPPVSWLGFLPGLEWMWWAKYQAPTYLCLAMLAGFGVEVVMRRAPGERRAIRPACAADVAAGRPACAALRLPGQVRTQTGSVAAGRAGWLILILIGAELLLLMPKRRPPVHDPLRPAPYVEFLRERASGPDDRVYAVGDWLHPQAGAALGIRDVRSYYGVMPRRAYWYVRGLVTGPARDSNEAVMTGSPRPLPALRSSALSAMAVRWVIAGAGVPSRAIPPWFKLRYRGETRVFENVRALPRARLAGRAVRVESAEKALYETSGAPADRETIFVEGPADWPGFQGRGGPGAARVMAESANRVECAVTGSGPRILLLADSWEPGWRAHAGERRLHVLPANCTFRAVAVPDGVRRVAFTYEPLPVKLGLLLSSIAATAVLLTVALAAGGTRGREGLTG